MGLSFAPPNVNGRTSSRQGRSRSIAPKVSVPGPFNLPSLRKEQQGITPNRPSSLLKDIDKCLAAGSVWGVLERKTRISDSISVAAETEVATTCNRSGLYIPPNLRSTKAEENGKTLVPKGEDFPTLLASSLLQKQHLNVEKHHRQLISTSFESEESSVGRFSSARSTRTNGTSFGPTKIHLMHTAEWDDDERTSLQRGLVEIGHLRLDSGGGKKPYDRRAYSGKFGNRTSGEGRDWNHARCTDNNFDSKVKGFDVFSASSSSSCYGKKGWNGKENAFRGPALEQVQNFTSKQTCGTSGKRNGNVEAQRHQRRGIVSEIPINKLDNFAYPSHYKDTDFDKFSGAENTVRLPPSIKDGNSFTCFRSKHSRRKREEYEQNELVNRDRELFEAQLEIVQKLQEEERQCQIEDTCKKQAQERRCREELGLEFKEQKKEAQNILGSQDALTGIHRTGNPHDTRDNEDIFLTLMELNQEDSCHKLIDDQKECEAVTLETNNVRQQRFVVNELNWNASFSSIMGEPNRFEKGQVRQAMTKAVPLHTGLERHYESSRIVGNNAAYRNALTSKGNDVQYLMHPWKSFSIPTSLSLFSHDESSNLYSMNYAGWLDDWKPLFGSSWHLDFNLSQLVL